MNNLVELANDILATNTRLQAAEHRVEFLERVLRQAVLSNDGVVKVLHDRHNEAISTTKTLWFGSAGVTLEHTSSAF